MLAANALVADGVDVVFTPTDNTIMTAELSIYETFSKAGIKHYTGADSFALNGAFLGYGVDYANLGRETADMIAEVLLIKKTLQQWQLRHLTTVLPLLIPIYAKSSVLSLKMLQKHLNPTVPLLMKSPLLTALKI